MHARSAVSLLTLALVAACSPSNDAANPAQPGSAAATASSTASASASGGDTSATSTATNGGTAIAESDDLLSFSYKYPMTGVAELDRWLAAELADERGDARKEATEGQRDARASNFPYRPYEYSHEWTLAGRTPQLVSLSEQSYAFTGGAHGNTGTEGQLWDRARRRAVDLDDILTSSDQFDASVRTAVCAALDVSRREKRGGESAALPEFNQCPDMDALVFIPTAAADAPFSRFTVIADPYVAGPYAEGIYRLTIPVTEAVLQTIKPEWRASFTTAR